MNTNILIVDDEVNVRQLLSNILKNNGYNTFVAESGEAALSILDMENIDVVISDLKMPGISGITLLEEVKRINPDISFIIITAFATTQTAIDALRNGASDYIRKPFDINEILHSVKKVIKQSDQLDSLIFDDENFFTDSFKTQSKSPLMKKVLDFAQQVAPSDSTVILTGETGTGKEVLATAIHQWSNRCNEPMIKINCAAIPENLLESELFGYEKGAFTGASSTKPGKFEIARNGTIFLDEIGDISPGLQAKLLRVLQDKTFERLGGLTPIRVDVRIICATNKNLREEVQKKNFREDLFYRLHVLPIHIPPLRERPEDIGTLVGYFLNRFSSFGSSKTLSCEAADCLKKYSWPGNIRELENIIERCVVVSTGSIINSGCLPEEIINCSTDRANDSAKNAKALDSLADSIQHKEAEVIQDALNQTGNNKTQAAKLLGISRRSLHRKLEKYHLR